MIQVNNLAFAFSTTQIFNNLNFKINRGEILSIVGPNGCGKSTLLRLLRGSLKLQSGEILWQSTPVQQIAAAEMARNVAVVPQSSTIYFPYKVRELVAMGRYPHRKNILTFQTKEDLQEIEKALVMTDILALADRQITQLSGGELQRVLLARALVQNSSVLFLDEATNHLDIDHRLELTELLVRLNREQGATIVQISHDLDLAAAISTRILLLDQYGDIVAIGSPEQTMTTANLEKIFRVEMKVGNNPVTGTPQVVPLINASTHNLSNLKVHVICGGGSGRTLMRRLHLAKTQVTAGPLNCGDTDEAVAQVLNIDITQEVPHSSFSPQTISATAELIAQADVLVVANQWWGNGNLPCLDLAEKFLHLGTPVFLLAQETKHDFTNGTAWNKIQQLQVLGAQNIPNGDHLLDELSTYQRQHLTNKI